MESTFDYYAVLGIREDADEEVIAAAYRALAKKYHPDSGQMRGTASAEKFRQIQDAYEVLKDAASRKNYDAQRARNARSENSKESKRSRSGKEQTREKPTGQTDNGKPSGYANALFGSGSAVTVAAIIGVGLALAAAGSWLTARDSEKRPLTSGFAAQDVEASPLAWPKSLSGAENTSVARGSKKLQSRVVGDMVIDDGNTVDPSRAFQSQTQSKTDFDGPVVVPAPRNAPYQ